MQATFVATTFKVQALITPTSSNEMKAYVGSKTSVVGNNFREI
jgi:hypothetical protein